MTESGAQPRRRRRAWPWVLLVLAALALLTVGVIVAVVTFATTSDSETSGEQTEWEEEYVSGEGDGKIAVLPVVGTISNQAPSGPLASSSATPEALQSQLEQAADDNSVRAVILEVNSPGGGVVASDEMHGAILDFKRETGKPVIVSMQDTAASGGYYLSTAADRIVANTGTLTGSIGVIFAYLDFSEAAEKYGVNQVAVTSGKFKNIGSPFKKLTPDEREILQGLVNDFYNRFVEVVSEGRDISEDRVREIADGRVYSGLQAKDLGLVDELGDLDAAAASARELANMDRATVVRYTQPPNLLESLQARLAPAEPEAVKILKAAGLGETPQFQYIYRPDL